MRAARTVLAIVAGVIAAAGFPAAALAAECAGSARSAGAPVGYNKVQLVPSGVPPSLMPSFDAAYEEWNDPACNPGGTAFPTFQTNAAPDALRVVNVNFHSGSNPRNGSSCAYIEGNDINIFSRALSGTTWRTCTAPNQFQDTLSHELGHLLGLQDQFDSSCSGKIMSQKEVSPSGTYTDREVQSDECAKVDEVNTTPAERAAADCTGQVRTSGAVRRITAALLNPCDDDGTGGSGPGGTGDTRDPGSPILIDLDRGGFDLTSVEKGVAFDIDGDGEAEQIAWTAVGSGDGFLVLDRNENGWIDDGTELFGNYTPQPPSREPHGFLALAVYDEDGDGWISPADAVYPLLRLWVDHDHDGQSAPSELLTLREAHVRAVSVEPIESRRRDRHGNELRYMALVRLTRGTTPAVDVFLLLE